MIAIPEQFAAFIRDGIASGRFRSEEDALTEALRLLQTHESRRDALRSDLQTGLAELDNGRSILLDADDIKQRGKDRLAGSAAPE